MKQSKQQKIGAAGEDIFPTLLPEGWIKVKISPDYGEDFRVRITTNEDVSPKTFTVQVKTVTKVSLRGNDVKVPIEQKDLLFWSDDNYRDAMFLVVIDLETRKGYWLYMRKYLVEVNKGWRNKKKPTIYVPMQNDMSNVTQFIEAINEGIEYNSLSTSISAKDQIEKHFAYLRSIDPRFDFLYLQDHSGPMIHYLAKEQVDVRMDVITKGRGKKETIQKAKDVFRRGRAVQFGPGELRISGSPLFDRAFIEGCTLQISRTLITSVTAKVVKDGAILASLNVLPGKMEIAEDEMRFETTISNSPFQWSSTFDRESGTGTFNIKHEFMNWHGKRISQARLFNPVVKFLKSLQDGGHIEFHYHNEGNSIQFGSIELPNTSLSKPSRLLAVYSLIRDVAEYYKIDPVIDLRIWPDVRDAKILKGIMNDGVYSRNAGDHYNLTVQIEGHKSQEILNTWGTDIGDVVVRGNLTFDVLGEKVFLEDIATRIDKMVVVNFNEARQQSRSGTDVMLRLQSVDGSKIHYMKAKDCPGLPSEPRRVSFLKSRPTNHS